jgi:malonyl-CoA O-methyltransferase
MIDAAINWINQNTLPDGGIVVNSKQRTSYPEVTGYYIPLLLSIGENELAKKFARWLTTAQLPDGSFGDPSGTASFAFDTGQVIRGWVSILKQFPEIEVPLRRACDWIIATADKSSGRLCTPAVEGAWSLGADRGELSEGVHIYTLAPLKDAGKLLNENRYLDFAKKSLNYYLNNVNLTDFEQRNAFSHFYAYIQEALVELDCYEEARRGMASVARYQQVNGSVPAYHDVPWVCSTGLAQLAKVWFLLGEGDRGDKALEYLANLQNPSGGFYGSYGVNSSYFPDAEISWAVKYAIEAGQAQIEYHFNNTVGMYNPAISLDDGRVQAILRAAGDLNGKKVLDAGCGKGRYTNLLNMFFPKADFTAADISSEMLKYVSQGAKTIQCGILNMPFANDTFDLVLCIEALEHVSQTNVGVRELVRVLAPGGKLVIIDKNKEKLGALKMPHWEKWFGREDLTEMLCHLQLETTSEYVSYDGRNADGLFICWTGKKIDAKEENDISHLSASVQGTVKKESVGKTLDSNLGPEEWAESITRSTTPAIVADAIRNGNAPLWLMPIVSESMDGDTLLELGSGTGELSAHLTRNGRNTVLLDFSSDALKFASETFGELGIVGEFVKGDVLGRLPFEDQSIDVVWSSGLLEHFSDSEIEQIVRESVRVAKKRVISLVPNAASLAYRLGKSSQELGGRWIWGKENPKLTLAHVFAAAGLHHIREYSIAPEHSLTFMDVPELAGLRNELAKTFAILQPEILNTFQQGYLLVTIGDTDL